MSSPLTTCKSTVHGTSEYSSAYILDSRSRSKEASNQASNGIKRIHKPNDRSAKGSGASHSEFKGKSHAAKRSKREGWKRKNSS